MCLFREGVLIFVRWATPTIPSPDNPKEGGRCPPYEDVLEQTPNDFHPRDVLDPEQEDHDERATRNLEIGPGRLDRGPRRLAVARALSVSIGIDIETTTDLLSDLDAAGWLDVWDGAGLDDSDTETDTGPLITLSPLGAERLQVHLIELGAEETPDGRRLATRSRRRPGPGTSAIPRPRPAWRSWPTIGPAPTSSPSAAERRAS